MGEIGREAAFHAWKESQPDMDRESEKTSSGPSPRGEGDNLERLRSVELSPEQGRAFDVAEFVARKQEKWPDGIWRDMDGPCEDRTLVNTEFRFFGVLDGHEKDGVIAADTARDNLDFLVAYGLEAPFRISEKMQKEYGDVGSTDLDSLKNFVERDLGVHPSRFADGQDVREAMLVGLIGASDAVKKKTKEGGTTVSLMVLYETLDGKLKGKAVNRGDSRLYTYDKGILRQITKDDSLVQLLLDQGLIKDDEDIAAVLSVEARAHLKTLTNHEFRSGTTVKDIRSVVTAGLGEGNTRIGTTKIVDVDLPKGALVLGATDGPIDNMSRDDLRRIIETGDCRSLAGLKAFSTEVVREAQTVSRDKTIPHAKPDDMGVVAALIKEVGVSIEKALAVHYENYARKYGLTDEEIARQYPSPAEEMLKGGEEEAKVISSQKQFNRVLFSETKRLAVLLNQVELALGARPKNEKMNALRDHLVSLLRYVGDRQSKLESDKIWEDEEPLLLDRKGGEAAAA